jgi:hypothetical protein
MNEQAAVYKAALLAYFNVFSQCSFETRGIPRETSIKAAGNTAEAPSRYQ